MKYEDIKEGKEYFVRVIVTEKTPTCIKVFTRGEGRDIREDVFFPSELPSFCESPRTMYKAPLKAQGCANTPRIKVKLDPGATLPMRAHSSDVGYDVLAVRTEIVFTEGFSVCPESEKDLAKIGGFCPKEIRIHTGIHLCPEKGYYVELVPNSRLAKTSYVYANSFGVIDPDYTGEIKVVLKPISSLAHLESIRAFLPGKTVGQLIVRRHLDADFSVVDSLDPTARADGGFGSTETRQEDYNDIPFN